MEPRNYKIDDSGQNSSMGSSLTLKLSRLTFLDHIQADVDASVELRKVVKVYEREGNERIDVTPKLLQNPQHSEMFAALLRSTQASDGRLTASQSSLSLSSMNSAYKKSSIRFVSKRASMSDVIQGIGASRLHLDTMQMGPREATAQEVTRHTLPYIRVVLRITDFYVLYEQYSATTLKNTPEGDEVEKDNKLYDHLTIGRGKIRRRTEAEAQTDEILYKSRDVNTTRKFIDEKGSYVSFYEMFDTYKALGSQDRPAHNTAAVVKLTEKPTGEHRRKRLLQELEVLAKQPNFKLAVMIMLRLLAGNEHETGQRRFRNMSLTHRLTMNIAYTYTVRHLFKFRTKTAYDRERRAVADISFCKKNGDIVAVAYGIYSFTAMQVAKTGCVGIWSIKNPGDPERAFYYPVPVVSVEFSPFLPQLIAIGLHDGSVEVRDITHFSDTPIAVSQRSTLESCDPVMTIKWIKQSETGDAAEIDPFLCLTQNGLVIRYRIINSPYLLGFKQMVLERVEGMPEGLSVKRKDFEQQEADRHPQGLNLTCHPMFPDIYYILTDEGCLHKCSTNYQHQHLEVMRVHESAVNVMDFSPWSPKLFLTCGNDWCIRIWIEGIFKPIITLQNHLVPIHCAYWNRTNSTIIVAINRKSIEIWDIERNILQPVSSSNTETSFLTVAKFSNCGRNLVVGNERGHVYVSAMDNMPFSPHFQYDQLEKAIYKSVATFPEVIRELKSVGFFGYPNKGCVIPP